MFSTKEAIFSCSSHCKISPCSGWSSSAHPLIITIWNLKSKRPSFMETNIQKTNRAHWIISFQNTSWKKCLRFLILWSTFINKSGRETERIYPCVLLSFKSQSIWPTKARLVNENNTRVVHLCFLFYLLLCKKAKTSKNQKHLLQKVFEKIQYIVRDMHRQMR